MSSYTQVLRS